MFGELNITLKGQEEFDLHTRLPNVYFYNIQNSAPNISGNWMTMDGSDGQRLQTVNFGATTIKVSLFIDARNMADFRLIKSQLQSLFYSRKLIRLRSSFEPGKVFWVLPNPTEIVNIEGSPQGLVDFEFINPSGLAQSSYRSDELPDKQTSLDFGMNIPADRNLSYRSELNSFTIFNPSDVEIDPYKQHHDMKVTLKGVGTRFSIANKTNGTTINVNSELKDSDTFILNGVTPYLNNEQKVDTDFGYIELDKGDNNIEITGLKDVDVTFSFPFLYF